MPRNMFLFNNAIYLLPYTGVGSGITRALDEDILEPQQRSWNALVYPIKPRTENVTSPPLLQQDICR